MKTSLASVEKRIEKAEKSIRAPTLRKIMKETRELIDRIMAEYNTPEAEAKRKADYQEICRIGELRRQAYMRGEPMDQYPLPWEKDEEARKKREKLREFFENKGEK